MSPEQPLKQSKYAIFMVPAHDTEGRTPEPLTKPNPVRIMAPFRTRWWGWVHTSHGDDREAARGLLVAEMRERRSSSMARNARSLTGARRFFSLALPAAVLGFTLLGGTGSVFAQGREEFRRGVDLFEQGKYAEAREELEKFLAASPGNEVALELRNEAGYQVFVEMLARKDDIASIARKILELAEKGEFKDKQDEEKINTLVNVDLFSEDEEISYRAVEELASRVGPFCVPKLVEHLAEKRDNNKRVKAIVVLSKLGPDGTNAVVALLKHKDDFVRQNAAAVLGHVRDFKAIPYLKALVEKKGESTHVQKEAAQALKNITGKEASSLDPAASYFAALGERYYQEDPSVMVNNFKEWTVWEMKDEKLVYRIVPKFQWNDELAEDCCYAAIEHGEFADVREADLDANYTLLTSVLFQQALETNELLEMAEEKAAAGAIDAAEVETLKAAKAKSDALPFLAASRGEGQIAKALRKALKDRRATLAVMLIEALRDLKMSDSLLPADGANLASYIDDGAAAPKAAMEVAPRREEAAPRAETQPAPTPAPRPAPKAEPAPAPKTEPAAEPKKEDPQPPTAPPAGGSRRRRVSEAPVVPTGAEFVALPYGEPATMRTLQSSGEAFGASMAAALTYEDKRVRYAASEALLRLAPNRKFANSAKVVENLSAAVQESGSRVIFVAAKDVQVRNRMLGLLRQMNHLPVGVASAKEALIRARSSPADDAIIVHTELNVGGDASDFTPAQFVEQIGVDYRTAGTPILLAAPKRSMETYEKSLAEKTKGVIADDIDGVVLKEKLDAIFAGATEGGKRDPKSKATAIAKQAAEAIAAADTRTSVFELKAAIPALMSAVESQPDAVRIPALRALGTLRARESVDKVVAIFDNAQNGMEVRVAAAYSLGESLKGTAAPSKIFESLAAGLKEGNPDLFRACSEALGKCQLTREQSRVVLVQQRVE